MSYNLTFSLNVCNILHTLFDLYCVVKGKLILFLLAVRSRINGQKDILHITFGNLLLI